VDCDICHSVDCLMSSWLGTANVDTGNLSVRQSVSELRSHTVIVVTELLVWCVM